VALIVTIRCAKNLRRIARKRATLDVMLKLEVDKEFQNAAAAFQDIYDAKGHKSLLEANTITNKTVAQQVDIYLYHWEIICIGILEARKRFINDTRYEKLQLIAEL